MKRMEVRTLRSEHFEISPKRWWSLKDRKAARLSLRVLEASAPQFHATLQGAVRDWLNTGNGLSDEQREGKVAGTKAGSRQGVLDARSRPPRTSDHSGRNRNVCSGVRGRSLPCRVGGRTAERVEDGRRVRWPPSQSSRGVEPRRG